MAPAQLWQRWRRRRQATAFEALVRDEVPYARDLARRMGASADEADDAVQESLLLLAKERSDDPMTVGLRAWICRRVVLRVKMRVRASSRRRRYERQAPGPRESGDPAAPLEMQDEVRAALRHLDESERHAVVLRYLHDMDYREIAYVLGVSENACRIRVHKALKRLRGMLGARAPALLAAVGMTVSTADAAIAAQAATAAAAAKKGAAILTAKHVAAAGVVAASVTTVAVVMPEEKTAPPIPPPPKVAKLEPSLPPSAEPEPDPEPNPPPPVKRKPTGLDYLREHLAGGRTLALWSDRDLDALVKTPPGPVTRIVARGAVTDVSARELTGPVVEFGPGVFRVLGPIGAATVRGAGKNETVLRGGLRFTAPYVRVHSLTVEDQLAGFDNDVCARFEHVVVRGFSNAAVNPRANALLSFRECLFLGGYHRPAGGAVLRVERGVLALFESCRFVDVGAVLWTGARPHPRSAVHLARARSVRTRLATARGALGFPVRIREARATQLGWGHPHAVEREGVTFETPPVRCRLKQLRDVVLRYRDAVAVQAVAWEGGPAAPSFVVRLRGGKTIVHPPDAPIRTRHFHVRPGAPPLLDLLSQAWPGLDPEQPAERLVIGRYGRAFQLRVEDAFGSAVATWDTDRRRVRR